MVITKLSQLEDLARRLREAGTFAIDTEFERERTYWPKLQLVQVGIPDFFVAVDPLALGELKPLHDLIADPSVEKIMHAGRQDAEIFFNAMGAPPAGIYDTQIAAALVGWGGQIGYANLVHRALGVRLKKTERVTDWGRRPLSDAQIEYALDDVRHLHGIKERLDAELSRLGRAAWLAEELEFYSDRSFYEQDPETLWRRVSGWRTLKPRGQAVLRELAKWREETAMRRDLPRNRVCGDDVLIEISLRLPRKVADLTPLRRLHPKEIEKSGDRILAAVKRGVNLPEDRLPSPVLVKREDPDEALLADLMSIVLKQKAAESSIAPAYLGTQKDVLGLVSWLGNRDGQPPPPLIKGWRKELVGKHLLALYEGKTILGVDGEKKVRIRDA